MSIKNLDSAIQTVSSTSWRIDALRNELLVEAEEKLMDTGLHGCIEVLEEAWWAFPGTVLEYEGLYINDNDEVEAVYRKRPGGQEVQFALSDLLEHASEGKVKIV